MKKKIYTQPLSKVVSISNCDLICDSLGVYNEEGASGIIGTKDRSEIEDVDFDQLLDIW